MTFLMTLIISIPAAATTFPTTIPHWLCDLNQDGQIDVSDLSSWFVIYQDTGIDLCGRTEIERIVTERTFLTGGEKVVIFSRDADTLANYETLSSHVLSVELSTDYVWDFDWAVHALSTGDTLGNLSVSIPNELQLQEDQVYNLMHTKANGAMPNQVKFIGLDQSFTVAKKNGFNLVINYQAGDGNDFTLETIAQVLGDANNDGEVNNLDLTLIKHYFGTTSLVGDSSHDSVTDLNDLFVARNMAIAANATNIPEPTTLFTILALSPLTLRRKNKN